MDRMRETARACPMGANARSSTWKRAMVDAMSQLWVPNATEWLKPLYTHVHSWPQYTNMTRKQSFKCSHSSVIFLNAPSNAVTKCFLLLSAKSFFTCTSRKHIGSPLIWASYSCGITTHSMRSDWPKIWHKNYYDFNLLQNRHSATDFNYNWGTCRIICGDCNDLNCIVIDSRKDE